MRHKKRKNSAQNWKGGALNFNGKQAEAFRGFLMIKKISLIVTDASPLITLAVANALDTLLLPGVKVIVPEMVRHEVISHVDKPRAQDVLDWLRAHEQKEVSIGSTEVWEEYVRLLHMTPMARSRNRGEEAAGEVLSRELQAGVDVAILLFEDNDVKKTNFLIRMPDNVLIMSTSAFLYGLERKSSILDANEILLRAVSILGDG